MYVYVCAWCVFVWGVCVCVCVCVCLSVCVSVRVYVRACARVRACVHKSAHIAFPALFFGSRLAAKVVA